MRYLVVIAVIVIVILFFVKGWLWSKYYYETKKRKTKVKLTCDVGCVTQNCNNPPKKGEFYCEECKASKNNKNSEGEK